MGIDNFNDYYDVDLKRDRAYELHKANVKLYKADVCDAALLDGMRPFCCRCIISKVVPKPKKIYNLPIYCL